MKVGDPLLWKTGMEQDCSILREIITKLGAPEEHMGTNSIQKQEICLVGFTMSDFKTSTIKLVSPGSSRMAPPCG